MSVVIENDGTKKVWRMSSVHWYLVSILIKRVLFVSVQPQPQLIDEIKFTKLQNPM